MKNVSLLAALALTLSASFAHADMAVVTDSDTSKLGFYLEPGLTYETMQSNIDYGAGLQNSSAASRGVGIVAKLGLHLYERFFAAADVRYGLQNFNDNANGYDVGGTSYTVAPVVGYQMKDWGVRLFVGYVVAGNFDPNGARGIDLKFNSPTGFRVGAGMKIKMFSVNVEWQQLHYGDVSVSNGGNVAQANVRYNPSGLIASLTFPIEL